MRTLKYLLSITTLGFIFLFFNASAQGNKSGEILKKVSKTYKSYKTVKAGFTIEIKSKQSNRKTVQKGTIYIKGKKFKVEMAGQEIFCDGKIVWTYLKDANEVQISKYDESQMEVSPSNIFTIYEKGFIHKFTGSVMEDGVRYNEVELTPVDKKKPFFKVKLKIDDRNNKISSMHILAKNGTTTTYKITSFEGNLHMNDSFFKFDSKRKPGVTEIDLR